MQLALAQRYIMTFQHWRWNRTKHCAYCLQPEEVCYWIQEHKFIGDVRGVGMMIGLDIVENGLTKRHAPAAAKYIREALKSRGVLVSTDGPFNSIVKMKPPLCFGKFEANYLLKHLHQVLLKLKPSFQAIVQYISVQLSRIAQTICYLHDDSFRELIQSLPIPNLTCWAFVLFLDELAFAVFHTSAKYFRLGYEFFVQREGFLRDTVSCFFDWACLWNCCRIALASSFKVWRKMWSAKSSLLAVWASVACFRVCRHNHTC